MDEGFASPTNIAWQGHTGVVEYGGGDRNMVCMFYNKAVPNPAKSAEKGRPINENKVFVKIHPPGERLNIVDREASDRDRQRFPMQWEQFRKKQHQQPEGTPIELLYPEQPVVAATLRAHGVQTVEQCAELSGPAIDNVGMGCQTWVNYSKRYLIASSKGASESAVRRQFEQKDREIKVLKSQVAQLKDRLEAMLQNQAQQPDLATMQAMLAGVMQRPQHMPQASFDPQTAMINAQGQATRGVQKRHRPRPRSAG
jgi:hypothetical protein